MALFGNSNNNVTVNIVGNAEAYRLAMKEVASDTAEFVKKTKHANRDLLKDDRVIQKVEGSMRLTSRKERKEALGHEKQLRTLLKDKAKALKEINKQYGGRHTQEAKKLRSELKEISESYVDIKKNRELDEKANRGFFRKKAGEWGDGIKDTVKSAPGNALKAIGGFALAEMVMGLFDVDEIQRSKRDASILGEGYEEKVAPKVVEMTKYGIKEEETYRLAAQVAKLTGKFEDVTEAQKMSYLTGMDYSQQSQFMGTMARGGVTSDYGASEREQIRIQSTAMAQGFKKARLHEIFTGMQSILETAQTKSTGDVSTEPYRAMMEMLGRSGKSGLQGARGLSLIQRADQAISGHGEASEEAAYIRRAYGWGIGGKESYFGAEKRRQLGLADEKYGLKNFTDIADSVLATNRGNTETASLQMAKLMGMNIPQAEDLMKMYTQKGSGGEFSSYFKEQQKRGIQEGTPEERLIKANEHVAKILEDEVYKAVQQAAENSNDLADVMKQVHPELQAIKNWIQKEGIELIKYLPDLVTNIKDLSVKIKEAVETVKEYFPQWSSAVEPTDNPGLDTFRGNIGGLNPQFKESVEAAVNSLIDKTPLGQYRNKKPPSTTPNDQIPLPKPTQTPKDPNGYWGNPSEAKEPQKFQTEIKTSVDVKFPNGDVYSTPVEKTLLPEVVSSPRGTKVMRGRGDQTQ